MANESPKLTLEEMQEYITLYLKRRVKSEIKWPTTKFVTIDYVVNKIYEDLVDSWSYSPIMLDVSRKLKIDHEFIRNAISMYFKPDGKPNELAEKEEEYIGGPPTPMTETESPSSLHRGDGRIDEGYYASLISWDDLKKARTPGAKDIKPRKKRGMGLERHIDVELREKREKDPAHPAHRRKVREKYGAEGLQYYDMLTQERGLSKEEAIGSLEEAIKRHKSVQKAMEIERPFEKIE